MKKEKNSKRNYPKMLEFQKVPNLYLLSLSDEQDMHVIFISNRFEFTWGAKKDRI